MSKDSAPEQTKRTYPGQPSLTTVGRQWQRQLVDTPVASQIQFKNVEANVENVHTRYDVQIVVAGKFKIKNRLMPRAYSQGRVLILLYVPRFLRCI